MGVESFVLDGKAEIGAGEDGLEVIAARNEREFTCPIIDAEAESAELDGITVEQVLAVP